MKILLANKFFYLNGGSERVFFQERDFLLEKGHSVMDFSMKDDRNFASPYSDYFVPNIDYHKDGSLSKRISQMGSFIHSNIAVDHVEKLIKEKKPDVAHLHNIYHQLTPSIIPALKSNGVKVVLTLHDTKLICPGYLALNNAGICTDCEGKNFLKPFVANCQNSRSKGLLLASEAFFHKWKGSYDAVDLFVSPSEFLADLTSKRIPRDKIRVLNNGIDLTLCQPNYKDDGYCLYLGRISKEKGVKTLLKAHDGMDKKYPLKIVGTGPLEEELKREFSDAEFLGYKSGGELNEHIRNAAFVVVPSECYENCSMVVLEAMAFGKPVVGSRIGGIPEQVEDNRNGMLFEMGNVEQLARKMGVLAEDKVLRKEMGQAGREKLEREYSLQDHCEGLLDIYSELLGRDVRKDVSERVQ